MKNKKYATQLPEISGVYMICVGDFVNFKPLYVGSSVNINKRVLSHFTTGGAIPKANKNYKLKDFIVLYTQVIDDWAVVEKRVINLCDPELNGHHKSDYNYTNCKTDDYKNLCIDIKKLMDGRKKIWLARKLGIKLPELSKKLNGLKSNRSLFFTNGEILKINEIFKANLSLATISDY